MGNMASLEIESADQLISLKLGILSVHDIIEWADRWIVELDSPSDALLDLAMMAESHPLDFIGKLEDLSPEISSIDALPRALRRVNIVLMSDPNLGPVVADGLYRIYCESGYDIPEELSDIGWFSEGFALASSGAMGTMEGVLSDLKAFAAKFE